MITGEKKRGRTMSKELHQVILEQVMANNIKKEDGLELLKLLKGQKEENAYAVIGMSGRYALSSNLDEFWENLLQGVCMIRDFPKDRISKVNAYKKAMMYDGSYQMGAYLDEIDMFDYKLYGLSKREASTMSPSQRIMLDVMYDVLVEAGYTKETVSATKTGIFVGHSDDLRLSYSEMVKNLQPEDASMSIPGNLSAIVASRLAYTFNMKGPSVLVDTACSSFLTALHLACQSLENDCDMAVVGGIKINLLPLDGETKLGMESSDGFTRTFSNDSDGTGTGEGAGAVVLKKLNKALADKDNIIAVIKGSAINQDGHTAGITVPNVESQTALLKEAWKQANIPVEKITYIESHGTGTKLGDPIEIDAITEAIANFTDKKQYCGIGSVKTNIGHLYEGAGSASFLKACLMMKKHQIPPTLFFEEPNGKIEFENSPLYVTDQVIDVPQEETMYIGINGFGFSGTNCHIVLEEYKEEKTLDDSTGIFTISADTKEQLYQWAALLESKDLSSEVMVNICYTQNVRRDHKPFRSVIVASDKEQLKQELSLVADGKKNDFILYSWLEEKDWNAEKLAVTEEELKLVKAYCEGEEVDWGTIYEQKKVHVISIPGRPKMPESCWLKQDISKIHTIHSEAVNWLVDSKVMEDENSEQYITLLTPQSNPVISDHCVMGENVLPGTAYIEMIHYVLKDKIKDKKLQIKELQFYQPVYCQEVKSTEVHIDIEKMEQDCYQIKFSSFFMKEEQKANLNAQAEITLLEERDLEEKAAIPYEAAFKKIDQSALTKGFIEFGPRWNSLDIELYEQDEHTVWSHVVADEKYRTDFDCLFLHPSQLDMAVNAYALTNGRPFLPYKFGIIEVYGKLGPDTYTCMEQHENKNEETLGFDLSVYNSDGTLVLKASNYLLKHVSKTNLFGEEEKCALYHYSWKEVPMELSTVSWENEKLLLIEQEVEAKGSMMQSILEKAPTSERVAMKEFLEEPVLDDSVTCILIYLQNEMIEANEVSVYEQLQTLFKLTKQLNKVINRQIRIAVVGKGIFDLENGPHCSPYGGAAVALFESYFVESPYISSVCISVDNANDLEMYLPVLIDSEMKQYAVQDGHIYKKVIEKSVDTVENIDVSGKNVLISGGFGGIGLTLAKYFAKNGAKSISLIARRSLEEVKDNKLVASSLKEIKEYGTQVFAYSCDLAEEASLDEAVKKIHAKAGKVSVVVHCAGIAGRESVEEKTEEAFAKVLAPKVLGTQNLYRVFESEAQVMYLMSSVASLTGMPGQTDYSSANEYMNRFAYLHQSEPMRIYSVSWPSWSEVGMAKDNGFVTDTFMKNISTKEAVSVFEQVARQKQPHVIAGIWNPEFLTSPYSKMLEKTAIYEYLAELQKNGAVKERKHKEVKLTGRADDQYTESEKRFGQLWGDVLEADEIDIYKHFNDLGGNSILASYLMKELESEYPDQFDITDIFTYSTVYDLSEYYDSLNGTAQQEDTVTTNEEEDTLAVLERLQSGEISLEEAEKLFFLTN